MPILFLFFVFFFAGVDVIVCLWKTVLGLCTYLCSKGKFQSMEDDGGGVVLSLDVFEKLSGRQGTQRADDPESCRMSFCVFK